MGCDDGADGMVGAVEESGVTPRPLAQATQGRESAAPPDGCRGAEWLWGIREDGWLSRQHRELHCCPGGGGEGLARRAGLGLVGAAWLLLAHRWYF